MTISEQSRHNLHARLEAVLGADEAATLMEHVPLVGWADVATKAELMLLRRELDAFEERLDLRIEASENRIRAELHAAIGGAVTGQTRTIVLAVIGSNLTMAALAFAAATLR